MSIIGDIWEEKYDAKVKELGSEIARLVKERNEARRNARLLAFAYKNDVLPGLIFNQAVEDSLAYPVIPEWK